MIEAADIEMFELAQEYKEMILAIQIFNAEKQAVSLSETKNVDVFGVSITDHVCFLSIAFYRNGDLLSVQNHSIDIVNSIEDSINEFINEFYESYLQEEFKDFYVVLLHSHAPASLHLNIPIDKEIKTFEELKNLKIRVPNEILIKFFTKMGALPTIAPLSEIYQQIIYGVLDGAVMPFEVAVPLSLHQKAQYHITAPFYTTVFAFLINKEFFNSLPKDIQKVIENNSRSNIAYQVGEIWDEQEKIMIEKVKQAGDRIYELSDEEIRKGKLVAQILANEWIKRNNEDLYIKAKALLKKYQKKYLTTN